MKKAELLKKIESLDQKEIEYYDLHDMFKQVKSKVCLDNLKIKVEDVFDINILSEKQEEKYFIGRSVFCHLAFSKNIKPAIIAKYLMKNRATVYNSIKRFKEYANYYTEFKAQINEVLLWDIEN